MVAVSDSIILWSLYGVLALGAAGLFGLLPGGSDRRKWAGAVVSLAVLVAMIVAGARTMDTDGRATFYFCVFGSLALFGAVRVITHRQPAYSALYFLLVTLAVAGLLVIADAVYLAAGLVIVYTGAIFVTYSFVILLARQGAASPCDSQAREPMAAVAVAFLLVASVASLRTEDPAALMNKQVAAHTLSAAGGGSVFAETAGLDAGPANGREVVKTLLTRHAVAVEVSGVLLLVAMIGASWFARRRSPAAAEEGAKASGRTGSEAAPS
ncbi:MAG: NADH-quinone oxidoreductase subunit J [Phycisphaerae bacterium]|nr:NADH-quinone oxidoreductase subunit J [Phycisphaerae bacterium]